jgi:hypothetical protein
VTTPWRVWLTLRPRRWLNDLSTNPSLLCRSCAFGTTRPNARWAGMPHRIEQPVRTAIDTPELGRAIRIMDNIHQAMESLTQISRPVLEPCATHSRKWRRMERARVVTSRASWFHYTQKALEDAPARERQKAFSAYTKTSSARDASSPKRLLRPVGPWPRTGADHRRDRS